MELSKINLDGLAAQVAEELAKAAEGIKKKHLDAGQKASGKTLNSIRSEVTVGTTSIRGIIYGRYPFADLETGRKPGPTPKSFYRIILDWMHFKGVKGRPIPYKRKPSDKWRPKYTAEDRGDRTLAYFIARKIRNEGTRLYRSGERKDIYSSEIKDVTERISSSLLSIFSASIDTINTKYSDEK